ncbi:MAG TPA: AbrB/MazE/SpoVT family DNA-binding domain-containing protein [Candidatus Competibacteraceae bacterium]|nr:AbrB/MazE/SpoVT family DNA-binding domain-containing protein [Candidatus Competibacteraceae bacterium]
MHTSSINSKGQVTIPAELRRSLGLKPGQQVIFSCTDRGVVITPVKQDVSAAFGLLQATKGVSLEDMEQAIEEHVRALHDQR